MLISEFDWKTAVRGWLLLLPVLFFTASPAQVTFVSSNLPVIVIRTEGQIIKDEPKIDVWMGIVDGGPGSRNSPAGPFNGYAGRIGIEIRGSTSQQYPKKQYGIKTRDSKGKSLDVSLLGMPAENDWVLYAPYSDKTLLRDVMVYWLASGMGHYASRWRFCELVLDDQYQGIYVLMEKIKRNKNRVNISSLKETDVAGDALTGGYLIKIDKKGGSSHEGWYSSYPSDGKFLYYQYEYPEADAIRPEQVQYIQAFMQSFEAMMNAPDYDDPQTGYPARIDVLSWIDVLILTEFSRNVDGYRLSAYMFKNRDSRGGRLVMGPVWDFNLAFGNANYDQGWKTDGWQLDFYNPEEVHTVPFWWKKLAADPAFLTSLRLRWQVLRGSLLQQAGIEAFIDEQVELLGEAIERNFQRWPVLGVYVWPNYYVGNSYSDEIKYLKDWLKHRLAWLDMSWGTLNRGCVK